MSASGPALFISRADGFDLDKATQTALIKLVEDICRQLVITDENNEIVRPAKYDYNESEPLSLGILLFSSYIFRQLPAEINADLEKKLIEGTLKIGSEIELQYPMIYKFTAYFVED